jgi:tetratricopeptide (TPR) repeat protein
MSSSLADQYYLQALEQYPWSPNEVIIALGYALSYDEDHARAHCLMGRLLMELVKDYQLAAHHFEISLLNEPEYVETYKYYSLLQIWLGNFEKAEIIIRRGMKVPGMQRTCLKYNRALLFEVQGRFQHAVAMLRIALLTETTVNGQAFLERELERLEKKARARGALKTVPESV